MDPLRDEVALALEEVAQARRELSAGITHSTVLQDALAASLRADFQTLVATLRADLGRKR